MATTRLAPSPTGALHLGNARTFLVNWLLARQNGWKILLRIEDLDGPRVKSGADVGLLADLAFLGLDWDEGPTYQSNRQQHYAAVIDWLVESGLAYPCVCSRREVELAASAPHADDGATIYPGICRGKFATRQAAIAATGREPAIRFATPDQEVQFNDSFFGPLRLNVHRDLGDFVIAKSDGTAAYQLAVVVDDLAGGVTHVVRGADLLDSTLRQILIYEAMGATEAVPQFTHLPLVVGPDGRRLAKRHGDSRIAAYREAGIPAGRILALLLQWCGVDGIGRSVDHPRRFIEQFRLDRLSRTPIFFTEADENFLRTGDR